MFLYDYGYLANLRTAATALVRAGLDWTELGLAGWVAEWLASFLAKWLFGWLAFPLAAGRPQFLFGPVTICFPF